MRKITAGGAEAVKVLQKENKKGQSNHPTDSSDLSSIDKASFLEGLQPKDGAPLHSTALEEDLNNLEEEMSRGNTKRKEIPQPLKKTVKQRGAAAKGTETERGGEEEVKKKASRKSTAGTSAARPMENQQMRKGRKKKSESGSGVPREPESQEESDTGTTQQRRRQVLSSEDEEGDEDQSWRPSPKKPRMNSLGRTGKSSSEKSKSRKSSSGSSSAASDQSSTEKPRRRRRGRHGGTQLEVVLEAFLEFCEQYRESVESTSLKKSVDSFSSNVERHILEKVASFKELKVLQRQNAKVGSLIRAKTQRLLEAKHELMRAERQMWLLQKEKAELEVRLADLRQGQAFLHDIRELNSRYLVHRKKHPKEKEMYGASSLPALLLETRHIQAEEHQLKGTSNRLKNKD